MEERTSWFPQRDHRPTGGRDFSGDGTEDASRVTSGFIVLTPAVHVGVTGSSSARSPSR